MDVGLAAAIGSAATWAMSSTLMATQSSRLDPGSISAIRLAWASVFFGILLVAMGQQGELAEVHWWDALQLVLGAAVGLGLGDTLYVGALNLIGLARAFTVSLGLFTVFAYVLSVIIFGDAVTLPVVAGSALVLASVYLVSFRGRAKQPDLELIVPGVPRSRLVVGLGMVVLVGLCWAVASVWTRAVAEDYSTTVVGAVRIPAAALLVVGFAAANRQSGLRKRTVSKKGLALLTIAGVVGTGAGSLMYLYALQEIGAGKAAVLSSSSPLFALPLGAIVLKEPITRWVAIGTLLAVTGIGLLAL